MYWLSYRSSTNILFLSFCHYFLMQAEHIRGFIAVLGELKTEIIFIRMCLLLLGRNLFISLKVHSFTSHLVNIPCPINDRSCAPHRLPSHFHTIPFKYRARSPPAQFTTLTASLAKIFSHSITDGSFYNRVTFSGTVTFIIKTLFLVEVDVCKIIWLLFYHHHTKIYLWGGGSFSMGSGFRNITPQGR